MAHPGPGETFAQQDFTNIGASDLDRRQRSAKPVGAASPDRDWTTVKQLAETKAGAPSEHSLLVAASVKNLRRIDVRDADPLSVALEGVAVALEGVAVGDGYYAADRQGL